MTDRKCMIRYFGRKFNKQHLIKIGIPTSFKPVCVCCFRTSSKLETVNRGPYIRTYDIPRGLLIPLLRALRRTHAGMDPPSITLELRSSLSEEIVPSHVLDEFMARELGHPPALAISEYPPPNRAVLSSQAETCAPRGFRATRKCRSSSHR
eukprot:1189658-Prorocentrum_minimum.AAC.4